MRASTSRSTGPVRNRCPWRDEGSLGAINSVLARVQHRWARPRQGCTTAGSRRSTPRAGLGVIVRSGAPKRDISSTEACKRALLNATSIGLNKDTPHASYLLSLMERLGIAEQMQPKTKLQQGGGGTVQAVAAGEVELGFVVTSACQPVAGVELLGPLPPELQHSVGSTAGVGGTAKEGEAGQGFINFLKAPAAVPVLKAKGLEPTTP
jgi:molybdate transport system substrate-binding protein